MVRFSQQCAACAILTTKFPSGIWLDATPSSLNGTLLNDKIRCVTLGQRQNLQLSELDKCQCSKKVNRHCIESHCTPATLAPAHTPCLFSIDLHTVRQHLVIAHVLLLLILSGTLFQMMSGVPHHCHHLSPV